MDDIVKLAEGVRRFRTQIFPNSADLFKRLAAGQAPFALFLTCADSRIVPSLMTNTGAGELFIERNPGNLVPVYDESSVGVSASIEYAITALGVQHVIICGHSDCGAVHGIMEPAKLSDMPAVARWLRHGQEAKRRLECDGGPSDGAARMHRLTRLNVVVQMENLLTHPSVQTALARDALQIHGCVYDIATGAVETYDSAAASFSELPLVAEAGAGV
jgi:carbonic anhydrase